MGLHGLWNQSVGGLNLGPTKDQGHILPVIQLGLQCPLCVKHTLDTGDTTARRVVCLQFGIIATPLESPLQRESQNRISQNL